MTEMTPPQEAVGSCPKWLFDELLRQLWPPEYLDGVDAALDYIGSETANQPESEDEPIIVLSAGWRTGSTFIQRLLNSDPGVLVFGEAFEHLLLWHRLVAQLRALAPAERMHTTYPPEGWEEWPQEVLHDALTTKFIATLTPPLADLKRAHLAFVDTLLHAPAARVSRPRWGIKLVRSDVSVAKYFRWLYPRAKLIFAYRNPYDAYQSFSAFVKDIGTEGVMLQLPSRRVVSVTDFTIHWRHCVSGFLEHAAELDALTLKYETLHDDDTIDGLEEFLDIRIDRRVLDIRVGEAPAKEPLSEEESEAIRHFAGGQIALCGY